MKLSRSRRAGACDINMTPMIDVVFQLIIFFMCSMQLVRLEVEEVSLPQAKEGEKAEAVVKGPVIVNIHKDGRVVMQQQTMEPEKLGALIEAAFKQRTGQDQIVVIRGDKETPWERIRDVLEACANRRIQNVKVAVLEGAGPAGS